MNQIEEKIKFSVVLPIYNVEKYLNRCLDSVMNQTYKKLEIILVDDGSPDNCPQMCDNWARVDDRIKVVHKKNAGLGEARNSGLDVATGDYIAFFDSDDYIDTRLFEELYTVIISDNPDLIEFGHHDVDRQGNITRTFIPKTPLEKYEGKEVLSQFLPELICTDPKTGTASGLLMSAWSCLYRRQLLVECDFHFVSEREYISEDVYFYIELFACLQKVSIMDDIFYCYCQNEGSLTFSYKKDRYERLKEFYQAVNEKANLLHYDGQVQLRLNESFIASVMGCLKMEVANCKEVGIRESYCRMKNISSDGYLYQAVKGYPLGKYEGTWKFFAWGIVSKQYGLLYIALLLKYITRGV